MHGTAPNVTTGSAYKCIKAPPYEITHALQRIVISIMETQPADVNSCDHVYVLDLDSA